MFESNEITESEYSDNDDDDVVVKRKEVVVHNLNRTDLNKSLECETWNNNINAPLSSRVYLDVYCKYHLVYTIDPIFFSRR